ncbi:MarR family transcriptional regulator [Melioribacter roseus P3M-2]|uniref:MarR family transcriptional regulator n=2 Tax=Melioribacteraceae TaxID=1334117 RepID=I6Z4B4_MELRP|nr:MarR family transcriptional regulator [Melioribacter roseus P3M-2]
MYIIEINGENRMKNHKKYDKKTELALNTWIKLARAYSIFSRLTNEDIKKYGLTQAQFAVIEALGHLGPLKVGDICKKILATGGNMTVVLDNAEKLGFIERRHDPQDRRAVLVDLSPKGRKTFEEIFIQHAFHITRLMSVLTQEEQKKLGKLLKKLGSSLGNE